MCALTHHVRRSTNENHRSAWWMVVRELQACRGSSAITHNSTVGATVRMETRPLSAATAGWQPLPSKCTGFGNPRGSFLFLFILYTQNLSIYIVTATIKKRWILPRKPAVKNCPPSMIYVHNNVKQLFLHVKITVFRALTSPTDVDDQPVFHH